jgi:hypothetical protein
MSKIEDLARKLLDLMKAKGMNVDQNDPESDVSVFDNRFEREDVGGEPLVVVWLRGERGPRRFTESQAIALVDKISTAETADIFSRIQEHEQYVRSIEV